MISRLKKTFAQHPDAYDGADLTAARQIGVALWLIGTVLVFALWPLSPPDQSEAGDAGWAIGAALASFGFASAYALHREGFGWTFEKLLLSSYCALVGIAIAQWMSGGHGAPYDRLLLIPVLFVTVLHPARRIAVFMAGVALVLALPLFYDGWDRDSLARAVASFVLWCAVAGAGYALMSQVRRQRILARSRHDTAHQEARSDELTKIGNRRAFEEAIADEIARSERMGTTLSVAMFDLVDFKQVNDLWGHLEGDACLRRVAVTIDSELRTPDRVFRWGGDEFAALLPGTGADGSAQVGDRLRDSVATTCKRPDGSPMEVRFGAAQLTEGMDGADLVEAADLALLASRTTADR